MRFFRRFSICLLLSEGFLCACMRSGLQYDVTFKSLAEAKCVVCYNSKCPARTTSANITSCAGPYLFVGAGSLNGTMLTVGAWAAASEVQKPTPLNSPHLSNGVYWYFKEGDYFGFLSSPNMSVMLESDERRDVDALSRSSKLLWSIDKTDVHVSHLRSRVLQINETLYDEKWIFSCQGEIQKH